MKHYRLAIAVLLFLAATAGSIGLLLKPINKPPKGSRGGDTVGVRTPPLPRTPVPPPPSTPKPTPTPTPLPSPSVKQIGNLQWRVVVPITADWFDTGIPVVTNFQVEIQGLVGNKWLTKLGPWTWFNSYYYASDVPMLRVGLEEFSSRSPVDFDFHDTIKVKVDDEGKTQVVTLDITLTGLGDRRSTDSSHVALHQPYWKWWHEKKAKVSRASSEYKAEPVAELPRQVKTEEECTELVAQIGSDQDGEVPPECKEVLKRQRREQRQQERKQRERKKDNPALREAERIVIDAAKRAIRRRP